MFFLSLGWRTVMCVPFLGQHGWAMSSRVVKARGRNPYAAVQVDPDSDYVTPGTLDLEQLFWTGPGVQYAHVNQVWPSVYIGDEWVNACIEQVQAVKLMVAASWRVWVLQENRSGADWPEGTGHYARSQRSGGEVEQRAHWRQLLQWHGHPVLWCRSWWQTHLQHLPVLPPCSPIHPWGPQSPTAWVPEEIKTLLDTWQDNEFIHLCFNVLQIRCWCTAWWVAAGQPLWFWPTWWWNTAYVSWTLLSMCDSAVASCPTMASWSSSEPWTSHFKRRGWGKGERCRSSSFLSEWSDLCFLTCCIFKLFWFAQLCQSLQFLQDVLCAAVENNAGTDEPILISHCKNVWKCYSNQVCKVNRVKVFKALSATCDLHHFNVT